MDTIYLETLCKKYNLPIFESPRDNFIGIVQCNKVERDELWQALDIYDKWLIALYTD